jgi:hypothetical protein
MTVPVHERAATVRADVPKGGHVAVLATEEHKLYARNHQANGLVFDLPVLNGGIPVFQKALTGKQCPYVVLRSSGRNSLNRRFSQLREIALYGHLRFLAFTRRHSSDASNLRCEVLVVKANQSSIDAKKVRFNARYTSFDFFIHESAQFNLQGEIWAA